MVSILSPLFEIQQIQKERLCDRFQEHGRPLAPKKKKDKNPNILDIPGFSKF